MAFNTLAFMLFMAILLVLFYVVPKKIRNPLLLVFSYLFYAANSLPLTLFLIICTLVTYVIAMKTEQSEGKTAKTWTLVGVVLCIGVLAFYKYLNFLGESINSIIGGGEPLVPHFSIVAPLGISFVIFSSVSYLIDVYRGKISAEKSLFRYALFLGFFPKVVQGPIAKAGDVLPQFDETENKCFDYFTFREGALQAVYGLFMKMVVADRLAVVVNTVYANPSIYSGAALTMATIMFSLQIYFDFAGYSLTAIGCARMLGFEFKENFRQPYLSTSVSEFWRRWHISLNRWLTDYVYIPLGGSRCSKIRADVNTLITFGISGLWHGANWGYLFWGLINGVYIVIEKRVKRGWKALRTKLLPDEEYPQTDILRGRIITFILIAFSWIFFRAQTLSASVTIISRIFSEFKFVEFVKWAANCFAAEDPVFCGLSGISWKILIGCLIFTWIVDLLSQKFDLPKVLARSNFALRGLVFMVLLFAIIIGGMYGYGYSASAFIYAQF